MQPSLKHAAAAAMALCCAGAVLAHDGAHTGGIHAQPDQGVNAPFDIVHAKISTAGNVATFHMAVSGVAGGSKPAMAGKLAGSDVYSYVWPTSMDPSVVGFDANSGILAFAVTAHPDFDDTPLFPAPLGSWHTHWVVLQANEACGKGALKVVDIAEGAKPRLPKTWPGLPILIDSPGWSPVFQGNTVEVKVPFDDIGVVNAAQFDGVTAGLRVNASVHQPLLCVANVFKVASGNLSLPGKTNQ